LSYQRIIEPTCPSSTLWLGHTEPFAYSLAGRPGLVVASTGLKQLSATQVAAVLSHERAHLRGRHHQLTLLTAALAKALPLVPLFRHAPNALATLVELAADAAAARDHGTEAIRSALIALNDAPAPGPALGIADHAVGLRLHQLAEGQSPRPAGRRLFSQRVTTVLLATLPAIIGLGTGILVTIIWCAIDSCTID
jgi:Zn-dependent protease with chaperone function